MTLGIPVSPTPNSRWRTGLSICKSQRSVIANLYLRRLDNYSAVDHCHLFVRLHTAKSISTGVIEHGSLYARTSQLYLRVSMRRHQHENIRENGSVLTSPPLGEPTTREECQADRLPFH